MSASVSGISGGQPSTTQPIATPWLSPKGGTRNIWPKGLKDMKPVNGDVDYQSVVALRGGRVKCPLHPSWPGLSRPIHVQRHTRKGVDDRDKPGHDDREPDRRLNHIS